MSHSKIVSFIIPSYNSENYLQKCLESFCKHDVLDSIEVIVINDGSTDRTEEIGSLFVQKYPQTFRIQNKINGGHGSAVNEGSQIACGKYFKIIDSDDWIITENLTPFVNELKKCHADVILNPYYFFNIQTQEMKPCQTMDVIAKGPVTLAEIEQKWSIFKSLFTLHGITYRADFYRKWAHLLTEQVFYEDQEYSTIPCCHAGSLYSYPLFLYVYRIGDKAQSVAVENQLRHIRHLETVAQEMLRYFSEHRQELGPVGTKFYLKKLENTLLSYYKVVCIYEPNKLLGRQAAMRHSQKLKKELPEVWKYLHLKCNLLILFNCLHFTPSFYDNIMNSYLYTKIKNKFLRGKV